VIFDATRCISAQYRELISNIVDGVHSHIKKKQKERNRGQIKKDVGVLWALALPIISSDNDFL
jgi:hypothetical protein